MKLILIILMLVLFCILHLKKKKESFKNNKKKLICFSLWGNNECYNWGALENALLAKKIYPGWTCRYYIGETVIPDVIKKLQELDNVELVFMKTSRGLANTLWRFKPFFEEDCYACLSRDTDSRLNIKEKKAIDLWLKSNKNICIFRDNVHHGSRFLAGMFSVKNNKFHKFRKKFEEKLFKSKTDNIWEDQHFLNNIYPHIKNDSIIFDSHHLYSDEKINSFPKTNYKGFIGDVICNNFEEIYNKYNIKITEKPKIRDSSI